jgi:hypothetical protein
MCTRLRVTTETSDLGKIESKLVLQPVNSIARTASEDSNQVVTGKVSSLGEDD